MARPTRLTDDVQEALIEAARTGLTRKHACALVGITYETYAEWIRRGDGTDDRPRTPRHAKFAQAISRLLKNPGERLILDTSCGH